MRFTVNGRQLELTADDVRRELRDVRPEPVHQYSIRVGSATYPVKQAFEVVTGIPRSGFTTQAARRVLAAVGFNVIAGGSQLRAQEVPHDDVAGVASLVTAVSPGEGDWYAEARVQAMLMGHLRREGWEIIRSADTARRERGVDIEATRGSETLAIEVRVFPASATPIPEGPGRGRRHNRAPRPKSGTRARSWPR